MPDKVKIYTKKGDDGETMLCDGTMTSKGSERVESYGLVDELNACIGLCIVTLSEMERKKHDDISAHLFQIQHDLLSLGANLAYPAILSQSTIEGKKVAPTIPRITHGMITRLEHWIDQYESELPVLKNFILSGGGTKASAQLHIARTLCRKCERQIVKLGEAEELDKNILMYTNRLSDYLFTAARLASVRMGKEDIKWIPLEKYFKEN